MKNENLCPYFRKRFQTTKSWCFTWSATNISILSMQQRNTNLFSNSCTMLATSAFQRNFTNRFRPVANELTATVLAKSIFSWFGSVFRTKWWSTQYTEGYKASKFGKEFEKFKFDCFTAHFQCKFAWSRMGWRR